MNKFILFLSLFTLVGILGSCKNDDSRSCVSCSSVQTPAFEVCEENDGTASVNGQNTGTSFDVYIDGLVAAGASCGN
jgi:hypothetical protein